MTYRARVLSSYIYSGGEGPFSTMGRRNRWFHGFVSGLIAQGSTLNEFVLDFVELPRDADGVAAVHRDSLEQQVQLVICAGTDATLRWTRECDHIPTLHFGAHPENNGLEVVTKPNVAGVRLNLPLIWNYENFSLLRALLPDLRAVYTPLNLHSEFAFPDARAAYGQFRRDNGAFWVPGSSPWCGHRSVHHLAERLGCEYFEGPFSSVDHLLQGLDAADPRGAAFVGFNDTVLMKDAANRFRQWCGEHGAPLFWVNNWPIISAGDHGGVADFSSHFEEVGHVLSKQALALLRDGKTPAEIGFSSDPGERFGLNLRRCRELSIPVSDAVRARFHMVRE